MIEKPPYSKISYPSVPLKDFKWESGSDVQALWRKHGWTPPLNTCRPHRQSALWTCLLGELGKCHAQNHLNLYWDDKSGCLTDIG